MQDGDGAAGRLWPWGRSRSAGLLLAALLGAAQAQQVCDTRAAPLSSPSARFSDEGEGLVTDVPTQLMWMRCALGQTWRGGSCAGNASLHDWAGAQAQAEQVNRAGSHFYNDWRVPSVRELATVTERQCSHPRINLQMFPATPSAPFWTSTTRVNVQAAAYVLDFAGGAVGHDDKTARHHVRLVRNAP